MIEPDENIANELHFACEDCEYHCCKSVWPGEGSVCKKENEFMQFDDLVVK